MTSLLLRALAGRALRNALAIVGIAASCLLVLVLRGAAAGVDRSVAEYVGQEDIDIWVTPAGTESLLRATALLPVDAATQAAAVDGVASAGAIVRSFVRVSPRDADDPHLSLMDIGYHDMGGPPRWVAGGPPASDDEVGLDRVAAWKLGVGVGDLVRINGRDARVCGLSAGTNLLAAQIAFQTVAAAATANGAPRPSYLVVRLVHGADIDAVSAALQAALPGTRAWGRDAFVANNRREAAAGFAPLFALSVGLGVAASALLVALIVHGLVDERRADMAVLLALGAPLVRVAGAVLAHGTLVVGVGSLVGAALALALEQSLDQWAPVLPLAFSARDVTSVIAVFVVAGAGAAAAAVARLRRIDPMEAFRT